MDQIATEVLRAAPPSAPARARIWQTMLVRGLEHAVEWMLLAILVVLPLDAYLVLPPSHTGVFLSEVLTAEAMVLLGGALLVARVLRVPSLLRLRWFDAIPLGLIVLAGVLSLWHATSRGLVAKECLKYVVYLGIYLLARACWLRPGVRVRALVAVWLGFAVVVFFGIVGPSSGLPDVIGPLLNIQRTSAAIPFSTVIRAESTFRYPNELAIYVLLTLPVVLASAVRVPWREERTVLMVLAALGVVVLFLTYTRGALVALVLALPLILFLVGGRRLGILGGLLILLGGAVIVLHGGSTAARLLSVFSPSTTSYAGRLAAWRWALSGFLHAPLTGVGAGNIALLPNAPWVSQVGGLREVDAENLYLNVLAELGLFGFTILGACLVGAIRRVWSSFRVGGDWADQAWNIGLLGALAAMLIYGFVDPVLLSAQVVGTLCALIGLSGARWRASRYAVAPGGVIDLAVPVLSPRPLSLAPELLARGSTSSTSPRPAQTLSTRLVFLIDAPAFGGAEQHTFNLAREAHRAGNRILIVCPPGSPVIAKAHAEGLPCRALKLGMNIGRMRGYLGTLAYFNPLSRRRTARAIAALASEAPTTFICPFPREQLLVTRLRCRSWCSVIWVLHSPLYYLPHELFLLPVWARLAREADAVATVTPWMATRLRGSGFPVDRLVVLPSAVPSAMLGRVPHEPALDRVPDLIAVISRLSKGKGIQYLIAAMPSILRERPNARLVIAGTGRYAGALRRQVALLGLGEHVQFIGYLARPEVLLRQASALVLPSCDPGEVLPASVLEAFALGTPVVASRIAAIPEIVRDRETGLLVRPGDVRGLASSVVAVLDQPVAAERMAAAGYDLVRARYTFSLVGKSFLRLADQVERGELLPSLADLDTAKSVALSAYHEQSSTEMRALMRPRLVSNTVLLTASKVFTAFATAVWTILAARALVPADYGALMLTAGLVELGAILTDAGFTTAATRELARPQDERSFRLLVGVLIWIKLALGLIAVAVTVAVTLLVPFGGDVQHLMLVMGPSLVFTSLNTLSLVFRARLDLKPIVTTAAAVCVLSLGGALAALLIAPTALTFALVSLGMEVLGGILILALVARQIMPILLPVSQEERAVQRRYFRVLGSMAVMLGLALALNILYVRIDVVLVALLAGNTQVAIYSSAYRIIDVVSLVPVSAAGISLPLLAALDASRLDHLRHFMQQYLDLAVVAGLAVALVLTLIGDPLLGLLYGGRYSASGPTLHVLAWAGAAMFVTNVFMPLAVALDRRRALLGVTLWGLVANVGLNLLLIPRIGPVGAALATLLTEFAVTLPIAWVSIRALHWRVDPYTILAAVEATGVALLCQFPLAPLPAWFSDTVVVLVWCGAFFVLAPRWVLTLVRSLRGRKLTLAQQRDTSSATVPSLEGGRHS